MYIMKFLLFSLSQQKDNLLVHYKRHVNHFLFIKKKKLNTQNRTCII